MTPETVARHMKITKRVVVTSLAAILLTGCASMGIGTANFADLEGVEGVPPDKAEVILNIDGHANMMRYCVDGLAFRSFSESQTGEFVEAVSRVPDMDGWCAE